MQTKYYLTCMAYSAIIRFKTLLHYWQNICCSMDHGNVKLYKNLYIWGSFETWKHATWMCKMLCVAQTHDTLLKDERIRDSCFVYTCPWNGCAHKWKKVALMLLISIEFFSRKNVFVYWQQVNMYRNNYFKLETINSTPFIYWTLPTTYICKHHIDGPRYDEIWSMLLKESGSRPWSMESHNTWSS